MLERGHGGGRSSSLARMDAMSLANGRKHRSKYHRSSSTTRSFSPCDPPCRAGKVCRSGRCSRK